MAHALSWHSGGRRFDPAWLHHESDDEKGTREGASFVPGGGPLTVVLTGGLPLERQDAREAR